jgi:hypothetical protein
MEIERFYLMFFSFFELLRPIFALNLAKSVHIRKKKNSPKIFDMVIMHTVIQVKILTFFACVLMRLFPLIRNHILGKIL